MEAFRALWDAAATWREPAREPPNEACALALQNPLPYEDDVVFDDTDHRHWYGIRDAQGRWLGVGITSVSKLAEPWFGAFPSYLAGQCAGKQVWLRAHYEDTLKSPHPYVVFREEWDDNLDGPPDQVPVKRVRMDLPEQRRGPPSLLQASLAFPRNAAGKSKRKRALREADVYRIPRRAFTDEPAKLSSDERLAQALAFVDGLPHAEWGELMMRVFGKERGCFTAEAVRARWSRTSTQFGTYVHAQFERKLNGLPVVRDDAVLRGLAPQDDKGLVSDHELACTVQNYEACMAQIDAFLAENQQLAPCRTEFRMFDPDICVTGTIDALFVVSRDARGRPREVVIGDLKTSWNVWGDRGERCEAPFEHWPKTDVQKFTVQVNLYRHIAEKRYGLVVVGMFALAVNGGYSRFQHVAIPYVDMQPLIDAYVERRAPEIRKLIQSLPPPAFDDQIEAACQAAERKSKRACAV